MKEQCKLCNELVCSNINAHQCDKALLGEYWLCYFKAGGNPLGGRKIWDSVTLVDYSLCYKITCRDTPLGDSYILIVLVVKPTVEMNTTLTINMLLDGNDDEDTNPNAFIAIIGNTLINNKSPNIFFLGWAKPPL